MWLVARQRQSVGVALRYLLVGAGGSRYPRRHRDLICSKPARTKAVIAFLSCEDQRARVFGDARAPCQLGGGRGALLDLLQLLRLELRAALSNAKTAKEVMDLQARIDAEQALIANDQMQLQGLAMMQDAERRLAEQRDREARAAMYRQTMDDYRAGFQ